VFYESIQSTADLKATYVDLGDSVEYSGMNYGDYYNDGIKSAPGKYKFDLSGSKNLASFEIAFGDGDTLISEKTDTLTHVHEYQKPGIYTVVLTTRSEENCQDSATVDVDLVFATGGEDGNFRFPNVFTPNADSRNDDFIPNRNDIFRSEDMSVLTIDITIFDRSGRKVHSYAGNIRDWEGWNGLIRNTNIQATEGVYFYVLTTFSAYQDKINPIGSKVMKGYFHLYRE
jgi:gliding motility-associated-like protein